MYSTASGIVPLYLHCFVQFLLHVYRPSSGHLRTTNEKWNCRSRGFCFNSEESCSSYSIVHDNYNYNGMLHEILQLLIFSPFEYPQI